MLWHPKKRICTQKENINKIHCKERKEKVKIVYTSKAQNHILQMHKDTEYFKTDNNASVMYLNNYHSND